MAGESLTSNAKLNRFTKASKEKPLSVGMASSPCWTFFSSSNQRWPCPSSKWLAGANPTLQEPACPRSNQGGDSQKTPRRAIRLLTTSRGEGFRSVAIAADGQSGIIWNHWKVTTQSCHAIHIRLQCPEDSILKANLVKLVNARYKQRV